MGSTDFFSLYREAVLTSLGYFWQALWAFMLGYLISSLIQVFVTRDRMQQTMGASEQGSLFLGALFGFISSSCSFSALSTTKALFQKGAGFMPALAFLLASTNLVVELGIIIAVFLGWQFVVGEYVGGILLIACAWVGYRLTRPTDLIAKVRRRLHQKAEPEAQAPQADRRWQDRLFSRQGWQQVARKYFMEWTMVWKDVTVGFTIAGIIAAFVPNAFFEALFIGAGADSNSLGFLPLLENVLVGPIAAFFTFIGSMGNIPLAAILYNNGVSFGGVMAFIFSDLVVFPVIRINARYYGWKLALYILGLLFGALVVTALLLHYGFAALGMLPEAGLQVAQGDRFALNYTFWLNMLFLGITGLLAWLQRSPSTSTAQHHHNHDQHRHHDQHHHHGGRSIMETALGGLAIAAYVWLVGGVLMPFVT
jgi:uncharacterized membrane protein YraQ (UPF0718 family)